jgi:hypothetical protein
MRTSTISVGVVALLLAVSAACGGDGDGGGGEREAERAIEESAQERAEGVVLQLSDFPDGWRASPAEEDDDREEEFRECVGVDFSTVTIIGEAQSDDFAQDSAEASSNAAVFETEADATTSFEELASGMGSGSANECLQDFLEEAVDPDVEVENVDLGELSFTPPSGVDDSRAWQLAIEASSSEAEGLSATVYFDVIDLRAGDVVARVQAIDVLSPFDPELRDELVDAVAGRMTD